jgi:hypothetical protein
VNQALSRDSLGPGKRTLVEATFGHGQPPVQLHGGATEQDPAHVQAAADRGLAGASGALPHGATIQQLFGRHSVSGVTSQVGGPAADACSEIGADAYASRGRVAFAQTPDLRTAAHEAAHVVQQRGDVQLRGGVGKTGDRYEQHADKVADLVVRGESAERVLDEHAPAASPRGPSAKGDACPTCGTATAGAQCDSCAATQAASSGAVQRLDATNLRQGGKCHETNRRSDPAHEAIQAHYKSKIDSTGAREYAIPGGALSGETGYADIVSLGTGAIYEIKKYNLMALEQGPQQAKGYLAGALLSCGVPPPWHLGTSYPDSEIELGDMVLKAKQYNIPGVILYNESKRQKATRKVKVPDSSKILAALLALGLAASLVPVVAAALADPEPASKLALAGLSVVMITKLLDTLGMGEDAPGGA